MLINSTARPEVKRWYRFDRVRLVNGKRLTIAGHFNQNAFSFSPLRHLAFIDPAERGAYTLLQSTLPLDHGRALLRAEKEPHLEEMLREYLPILVFLAVAIGLGLVLILAAVIIAVRNPDPEKVSAYECGFNAFDDARMKFDVRFYLVSILFIIFDLEIAFLFPWAVAFQDVSMVGFWSMMVFLGVLTIGFAYEWKKGALEWQ